MARLWTCGFEMQSVTAGIEWSVSSGTATVGAPTISTGIKRRGTASLRCNPTAGNQYIEMQIDGGTVKRTLHRFYLYVATRPDVDVTIYGIGQSGYFPGACRLKADGTLTLRDGFTSTDLGTPSAPLETGRWYRVELDYTDIAGTAGSVTGAFKGYLDGALFADTLCSNINGWSRVRVGPQTPAATCDVYIDDVAVNDDTGTAQSGLPGAGCVVHMYPDGAGDSNLWDVAVGGTAGQANNWTRVNQRTPDDSTSYNQTASTGTTAIDDFALEPSISAGIGAADRINVVQVGGRISSDATTAASIVYRLKSQTGGAVAESGSVSTNVTTWQTNNASTPRYQRLTSYADPQDGTAWTAAKLGNAQVGYRANVSQTTIRRVSGVWLVVDFVPRYDLGAAVTVDDAFALVYDQPAIPTFSLKDDFNDNTVDSAKWPNSYGYHVEAGGRAQVGVDENYNAYSSAKQYRLAGSKVIVQPFPPAMPDGATESWMQLLILSTTAGIDLGWSIEIRTGELSAFNRTGYWDPEAPYWPFDPVNHAWLKIEEADGTVTWSTSPDGHTWTVQRSIITPDWVITGNELEIQMIGHRADGVANYSEWDNFNTLPVNTVELGAAASKHTAREVVRRKRLALGTSAQTATARALVARKATGLAPATAPDGAHALTARKATGLGAAADRTSALAPNPRRLVAAGSGQSASAGYAHTPVKSADTGNAARTSDLADSVSASKRSVPGVSGVANAGHPVRAVRNLGTGLARGTSSAHPVFPVKSDATAGPVAVDQASPVSVLKSASLGAAASGGVSQGLVASHRYRAAPAAVQALGGALAGQKRTSTGHVTAHDGAHDLQVTSSDTLSAGLTTDGGHEVTPSKHDPRSTPAADVETARSLFPAKTLRLATAHETASVRPPAGRRKTFLLGLAAATQSGAGVGATKLGRLGSGQPVETAHALSAAKLKHLGRSTQVGRVWSLDNQRAVVLGSASTADTPPPLSALKTRNLATCAAADSAAAVAFSKLRPVDRAAVAVGGHVMTPVKRVPLGVAREADESGAARLSQLNRMLNPAEVGDHANPVNVYKQRPADRLVPGWTEPGLTPGTSASRLRAQSTRPGLSAGHTTGGS
jgi:hypothetical protein